ncbi:sugar kinase [Streptomyces gardneri]|uniref:sugar kinase n=1 Tax=Streptomyces gardneri TaxID=66892 RepID=UPI0035D566E8
MTDVLTFGEALVTLRAEQSIRNGGSLRMSVAGAEVNVAIGLARLGHAVRWVGCTSRDEFGALVLRTLRAENVDVRHAALADGPTGLVVFEPRIADLTRVSYRRSGSAGSRLAPTHVEASSDVRPRVVHLTGITAALGPGPLGAVRAAAEAAAASGATLCFDVNHRAKLWSREEAAAALRPLMGHVDILVASDDELALAAPGGTTEDERVEALLEAGVREVVVKRGADGAQVFDASGAAVARPALSVPVKDTVGAGDAFVAGYLSALLDGEPVERRLERGVALGAFAVASQGDWEGLPVRDELGLLDAAPGSAIR